jgi:hypothetical protein
MVHDMRLTEGFRKQNTTIQKVTGAICDKSGVCKKGLHAVLPVGTDKQTKFAYIAFNV